MEAEGRTPPDRHTRRRSLTEPQEPRARRRSGNADAGTTVVSTETRRVAVSDGVRSTTASHIDVSHSTAGSNPTTPAAIGHFCGHCQKRFRSPGKLVQHERVHATRGAAFYGSLCPKQFSCESKVATHERTHTGEKPYACSMCPRRFAQKCNAVRHERTHTD